MKIFQEIKQIREVQDNEWGGAGHDDLLLFTDWLALIIKFTASALFSCRSSAQEYRRRMAQIAALAIAACESYDRQHSKI